MDPQNTPASVAPSEPPQIPAPAGDSGLPPLPSVPASTDTSFTPPTVPPPLDPVTSAPPVVSTPLEPASVAPSEPTRPAELGVAEPSSDAFRQQVVDRLKSANNVLVTVGSKPTVDELSSALGLTLQLDKLDKHATTVFSGEIPKAIEFLDPEATFENNVDSLRDFIIALDKEKADKLRYKVEDDVVRIFITPYKTKISEKDLQFSQSDFNVEVIVALGVVTRDDLDKAITAHGRILHDATVITVNAGGDISNLGAINWSDDAASSIAEMLVGVGDQLGTDMLDTQSSTAYLTGIVAATNRFSNDKTSPKVMNLAAQLMAAGANQQLIASNLRQDGVLSESINNPSDDHAENEVQLKHHDKKKSQKIEKKESKELETPLDTDDAASDLKDDKSEDGTETPLPADDSPQPPDFPPKIATADEGTEDLTLPDDLKQQLSDAPVADSSPVVTDVKADSEATEPATPAPAQKQTDDQPAFNATMAQVEAEKTEPLGDQPATTLPGTADITATVPSSTPVVADDSTVSSDSSVVGTVPEPAGDVDEARQAVEQAMAGADFNPANQPLASIGAQPLPSVDTGSPSDQPLAPVAPSVDGVTPPPSGQQAVSSALPQAPPADDNFMSGGLDQPEPTPMDSFMSAHQKPVIQPSAGVDVVQPAGAPMPTPTDNLLPPMPPLPQASSDGTLPPLPPTPGQDVFQPTAQPALSPDVNPGFMQGATVSQNTWSQAADDLAAKNAAADQNRQAKMDEMTQQYDQAVDRNLELQGNPPVNDPSGSGLPPLPPA